MNINITVWPKLTDNYFIFALPDFQLSGRKGNLFDYFVLTGNIEPSEDSCTDTAVGASLTRNIDWCVPEKAKYDSFVSDCFKESIMDS